MEINTPICDNCNSESNPLTTVHIRTGTRGRPPKKDFCNSCLESQKGTYYLPGERAAAGNSGEVVNRIAQLNLGNFDPAAVFLLHLRWENLFEPYGENPIWIFHCKGCHLLVTRIERERHYQEHKAIINPSKNVLVA